MAISLVHAFASAKGDGGDATLVQPSNWNAQHTLNCATGVVLGRATAGTGAVEELSCTASGRAILAAADSNAAALAVGAIPIGGGIDWWDDVLPAGTNGVVWGWGNGQAISRTTYATLFARWGTQFGGGDGSTTFNVPDVRERIKTPKSTMGGTVSAARIPQYTLTTVGATIGEAKHTLTQAELPNVAPTFTGNSLGSAIQGVGGPTQASSGSGILLNVTALPVPSGTISSINGNVTQQAHNVVQPGIVCNYILRFS